MKSTGIVRKVDELGRIVLPIELRRSLKITQRDALEIYVEDDKIILQKESNACVFCGRTQGLAEYRGRKLCSACLAELETLR